MTRGDLWPLARHSLISALVSQRKPRAPLRVCRLLLFFLFCFLLAALRDILARASWRYRASVPFAFHFFTPSPSREKRERKSGTNEGEAADRKKRPLETRLVFVVETST